MKKCEYGSSKAATSRVLQKKVLLKIPQNSQKNTCGKHFLKKLRHRCSSKDFVKFLRKHFVRETGFGSLPARDYF